MLSYIIPDCAPVAQVSVSTSKDQVKFIKAQPQRVRGHIKLTLTACTE